MTLPLKTQLRIAAVELETLIARLRRVKRVGGDNAAGAGTKLSAVTLLECRGNGKRFASGRSRFGQQLVTRPLAPNEYCTSIAREKQ
jgi:hypothetical protein